MGRGPRDRRRPVRAPQRRRPSTSCRPSAMPTSTPRGSGRSPRRYRKCVRTFSSPDRLHGPLPGVPVRLLAGPAVRLGARAQARPVRPDPRTRRRGQWLPVGGTWVEPDCNLPSGESLVRQFLHGQRFFEREFGRRCREFWNPDVFGYNGQLPQIMRGAGIDRFLTQKLSWNRFNQPAAPHIHAGRASTGRRCWPTSRRPTPTTPPRGRASCAGTRATTRITTARSTASLFGFGDGGGGPTPAMLETLRRAARPPGRAAHDDRARRTSSSTASRPTPPTGRPSSASCTSSTTAAPTPPRRGQAREPRGRTGAARRRAPGGGAARVPGGEHPARARWTAVAAPALEPVSRHPARLVDRAGLRGRGPRPCRGAARGEPSPRRRWPRSAATAGGDAVNTIGVRAGPRWRVAGRRAGWVEAPPLRLGAVGDAPPRCRSASAPATRSCSRTAPCARTLGPDGACRSLVELETGREALAAPGNRAPALRRPADRVRRLGRRPVPPGDRRRRPAGGACAVSRRPAARRGRRSSGGRAGGTLRQIVRLDAGSRRLEFHCEVDWRRRTRLLKVLFPVAVRAPNATYEMQFGTPSGRRTTRPARPGPLRGARAPLRRPLRARLRRRPPDRLQVRLLDATANEMRISLLRSPTEPDPRGRHAAGTSSPTPSCRTPAAGARQASSAEAAALRGPAALGARRRACRARGSRSTTPNLVLDTVKRAEDSDALVLRLYEAHGARGTAALRVGCRSPRRSRATCWRIRASCSRRMARRSSSPTGPRRS